MEHDARHPHKRDRALPALCRIRAPTLPIAAHMKVPHLIASILATTAALAPSFAHADDMEDGEPAGPSWFAGGSMGFLPAGSIRTKLDGHALSADTSPAVGLGMLVDKHLGSTFAIGLAPRYVLGVKGTRGTVSAGEADLRVRITLGADVSTSARLYALVMPGYSWVLLPDLAPGAGGISGPSVAIGGGAQIAIAPRLRVVAELGYQAGFQGGTEHGGAQWNGEDFPFAASFVQIELGITAALD
jgi:hypothetical protein